MLKADAVIADSTTPGINFFASSRGKNQFIFKHASRDARPDMFRGRIHGKDAPLGLKKYRTFSLSPIS